MQGPWVVAPATHKAAHALSAIARAAAAQKRMAVVRYALTASGAMSLGVLVPVLGQLETDFDHCLLFKVPWANEFQSLHLPEHEELAVRFPLVPRCSSVALPSTCYGLCGRLRPNVVLSIAHAQIQKGSHCRPGLPTCTGCQS